VSDALAELLDRARDRRLPPPSMRRRLRRAAGLAQRELAAVIGVTRLTLARWELGRFQPRGARRERYAAALARLAAVLEEERAL